MKELLEKYEIESIEEFDPMYDIHFYIQNLVNGIAIETQAKENLIRHYSKETLIKIENYNEIGIVEYVAKDSYYIEDNLIKRYED